MVKDRKAALLLIQKQFKEISQADDLPFSVGLEKDDLFTWNVSFQGPPDSLYEEGLFFATLSFPDNFPNLPPTMRFLTKMFHPNIYKDGTVCISILHAPGTDSFNEQETADERWRPIWGIESVLVSVVSLLSSANLDSPANIDAANLMKEDLNQYKAKVRKLARESLENL